MIRDKLKLYFIMGSNNTNGNDPLYILEEALKGGVTCFQFREKGKGSLTGQSYFEFADACQRLCKAYKVPFIVNDDVDLAISLDADGVHVGQDDEQALHVRQRIGNKILGVSVHTNAEAEKAIAAGADYIGIGPIYRTETKKDAKSPAGTSFLQEVSEKYPDLPIVGIGGIHPHNVKEVIESGADGISVISAISHSEHPRETAVQFLKGINTART